MDGDTNNTAQSNNLTESSINNGNEKTFLQKKSEQFCRLCAKSTGKMVFIFNDDGSKQGLAYKINSCLPITVKVTDPLPKQLCSSCIEKLNIAYEFSENCVVAENKLNACAKAKAFSSSTVQSNEHLRVETKNNCSEIEDHTKAVPDLCNTAAIATTSINANCGQGELSLESNPSRHMTDNVLSQQRLNNKENVYFQIQDASINLDVNSNNYTYNTKSSVFESSVNMNYLPTVKLCDIVLHEHTNSETKTTPNKHTNCESKMFSCPLCCLGRMKMNDSVKGKETEAASDCKETPFSSAVRRETEKESTSIAVDSGTSNEVPVLHEFMTEGCNQHLPIVGDSDIQNFLYLQIENRSDKTATQNEFFSERYITCQICGELFSNTELCINHSKNHAGMDRYPCSLCDIYARSEEEWTNHCQEHLTEDKENECGNFKNILCHDCNQICNSEKEFYYHICPPKQLHKCEICIKFFVSQLALQFHYSSFHSGPHVCCELCGEAFDSPTQYFTHTKTVHSVEDGLYCKAANTTDIRPQHTLNFHTVMVDTNRYNCENCGKQFQNHEICNKESSNESRKCDSCSLSLINNDPLLFHALPSQGLFPPQTCFQCSVCEEVFAKLPQTLNHIHTCHNQLLNATDNVTELNVPLLYQCEYCEKCYADKCALKIHCQSHSGTYLYICKFCNAAFSTYYQLTHHEVIHITSENVNSNNNDHSNNNRDQFTIPRMFVCLKCDKCFPQWSAICQHRKDQHEKNVFKCQFCNAVCSNSANLTLHMDKSHQSELKNDYVIKSHSSKCEICGKLLKLNSSTSGFRRHAHTKRKFYICEFCGESFRLKNSYNKHYRKHTGKRPFGCDICGKSFSQNSGLYTHKRVHTGEKPYACDLCEKTFRLKHDRDNHRRCHTGERPYKCHFCGKAFRTSHDNRQHILIHTGQRPYSCNFCGKGFRRINGLNVHKRIHTGEKPYGCEICGRHFTQKGDMLKHRKTQHNYRVK